MTEQIDTVEVLKSNVKELKEIRNNTSPDSALRAIQLAQESVDILFTSEPRPENEGEERAWVAGEAMFEAGGKIHIWGQEENWSAWIDRQNSQDDETLQQQKQIIQEACDNGLRWQASDVAGKLAVHQKAKVVAEQDLLRLAGAYDLRGDAREKMKVFGERISEMKEPYAQADHWLVTRRTNLDELPQMQQLNEIIRSSQL